MYPLLAPHVCLAWRDSETLAVVDPAAPDATVVIGGANPATVRWLQSCDGRTPVDGLLSRARSEGIEPASAEQVLAALNEAGLLAPLPPFADVPLDVGAQSAWRHDADALALGGLADAPALTRRQEHHVAIDGTNRVAHALVDVLAAARIGALQAFGSRASKRRVTLREVSGVGPTASDVGALPMTAMKRHIRRVMPEPTATRRRGLIIATDAHLDPGDEAVLQRLGLPYLRVLTSSRFATIGPLTLPGASACWACIELHRADIDPSWPHVLAQFEHRRRHLAPVDTAWAQWVASTAAMHLLRVIDAADPAPLLNTTLHLERSLLQVRRQHWTQHPECTCNLR